MEAKRWGPKIAYLGTVAEMLTQLLTLYVIATFCPVVRVLLT